LLASAFGVASAADFYAAPGNMTSVLNQLRARTGVTGLDRLLLTTGAYTSEIKLTSAHSNIVVMPAPGNTPVISGFLSVALNTFNRVTNTDPNTDPNFNLMGITKGQNVWVRDLSSDFSGFTKPSRRGYPASNYFQFTGVDPQVYVGNDVSKTRRNVARYPNTNEYLPNLSKDLLNLVQNESPSASSVIPIFDIDHGDLKFDINNFALRSTAQARINAWKQSKFLTFDGVQSEAWVWTHVPVTTSSIAVSSDGKYVTLLAPMFDTGNHPEMNSPYRTNSAFFEGSPYELDNDDEYFFDYDTKKLYIYSTADLKQSTDKAFLTKYNATITFAGAANVEITGLTFEGGSVTMITGDGSNIKVSNCKFQSIPVTAISLSSNSLGSASITNNVFTDIGRAVIKMTANIAGSNYEISYNKIQGWGWFEKVYAPAISVSGDTGVEVMYNKISHSPHEAIHLNNLNHNVHHNEISYVALEFRDMGAVYASNAKAAPGFPNGIFYDQNLNIHHNYFHDFGGWGQYAIYVDDLASGWNMHDNYFVNTFKRPCQSSVGAEKYAAVYVHGGVKNVVSGNHFLNVGRSYRYLNSDYSAVSACGYVQTKRIDSTSRLYDNYTATATKWSEDNYKQYANVFKDNFWYNQATEVNLACAASVSEIMPASTPTKVVASAAKFYSIEKHELSTRRSATKECEIPGFEVDFPHICGKATGNTASGFFNPNAGPSQVAMVQTKAPSSTVNALQPSL